MMDSGASLPPACEYALSLKQPWATLLVCGRKTIEVRRWPTARRGRVLIHAAGLPDKRPEAWAHLPQELHEKGKRTGGIIGAAELMDCVTYAAIESFAVDQQRHLNEVEWFEGPKLYGFVFSNMTELPFRKYPGWVRFFPLQAEVPQRRRSGASRKH